MEENNNNNNFNVKDLTDFELNQKALDMNQLQLLIIRDMSYYYVFGKTAELIQLLDDKEFLGDHELENEKDTIVSICNRIVDSYIKYNSDTEIEENKNEVEELLEIREQLYNLSSSLYGYGVEISYMRELSEYSIMKSTWEEQYINYKINREEVNYILNKIGTKLEEVKTDYNTYINTVSNIIAVNPFRMSKYKYFDIIKSTLTRNFSSLLINIAENQVEKYKMAFDATLLGDYGILFDGYFTEIQSFKNIDLKSKSVEELRDITAEESSLESKVMEISAFVNNLGIMVNRLIVLHMTKDHISITSDIKNDYDKWRLYIHTKEEKELEYLISKSNKRLENKEKELMTKIQNFDILIRELSNRNLASDEEINSEVKNTREILTFYNDVNLAKYQTLFPEDEKFRLIGEDHTNHIVDSLIQYINRSISSMNGIERKIRMRRLLSMLELPFKDVGEFLSYIENSLDEKFVSKGEIIFTMDTLNHILDEHM